MMGRTTVRGWLLMAALLVAACGPIEEVGFAADVERELDLGRAYAAELASESRPAPTVEEAIEAGYLERLRLGLGSPFRLIEYSLQDPRLPRDRRERLAWSLLAATMDGESYRIDPRGVSAGDEAAAAGHLELVERAIAGSAHPAAGVLAVRLAYGMAAAESTVPDRLHQRISLAAALIHDRAASRSDARRLLRAAGSDTDPMALLTVWRVEGRFAVEKPASALAPDVEREAIALAPRLLQAIREVPKGPDVGPLAAEPERDQPRPRPVLGPEAAGLLAVESATYDAPPQTPVVVEVRARQKTKTGVAPAPAVERFYENALNEERLAAELALLSHTDAVDGPVARAVLSAAVGLRAYAQERPWFPGFDGPTRLDLEDRFGLASIEFPESVPAGWRPYYRRMLETALSDLQRILPSLDVRGLKVRFEARPGSPGTLAVHDPRTRTVYIPPETGAGTIAHEIAHDIDWMTALRRYRVRGDYATDRAVRLADERLARVLRGLSTTALAPPGDADQPQSHANRPAEVFARSVDWFVAAALARDGRLNGYLSSVQDQVLTGYGTVAPPDITGAAGQALMALLDDVAPVYPETRRWFLGTYGRQRAPTASDLARRLAEAPLDGGARLPAPPVDQQGLIEEEEPAPTEQEPRLARIATTLDRLEVLARVRDAALETVDHACRPVGYDNGAQQARRRLVAMVTEARARGLALDAAAAVAGREGRDWVAARLNGRSRDAGMDPVVADVLGGLVDRVNELGHPRVETSPLAAPVATTACGPVPFPLD
jgi:hypothetical protein